MVCEGKGNGERYIYPFYFWISFPPSPPVISARSDRHLGVIAILHISEDITSMSTSRAPAYTSQRDDQPPDDSPPPYTLNPTDDVSLEFGPTRPFRSPPQQPRQDQPLQPPPLSDFARDFYATAGRASRPAGVPHQPPLNPSQSQNPFPDDGRPTRTPVPGHPLLNNGKTLVYTMGYECDKCPSFSSPPVPTPADGIQATTPAIKPLTLPTLVVGAGRSIRSLIRALSSTHLGTMALPTDSDLS